MRENPVFSRVLRKSFKRKTVEKMGKNSRSILCLSITRFSCTQQKSSISCWVMVIIIHCSPDLTRGCCLKGLHLNLMCRNMDMSNIVENEKPPLPKGRGNTEGGGGIKKRDL